MKTTNAWSYHPYRPTIHDGAQIYVSRLAPSKDSVTVDWLCLADHSGGFEVLWRKRGKEKENRVFVTGYSHTITGLKPDTDYEVRIAAGNLASQWRLVRTSAVLGTVVNYLHPEDGAFLFSGSYLGSPSLVKTADGTLLAAMNVFGKRTPQNLTQIFRSTDRGESWHYVCDLFPCFWGTLFEHRGDIYMLGLSNEYGDLLIGRSRDGGQSFETPTVLLRSSCSRSIGGLHKGALPVVEYQNRLWTSIEYGTWDTGGHFHFMLLSASVDADLTDAASWVFTDPVAYDPDWPGAAVGLSKGCIEGNAAVSPEGKLCCLLRYEIENCVPSYGKILMLSADPSLPEQAMKFEKFVDFNGNKTQFFILRDPVGKRYYGIGNRILDKHSVRNRNILSLYVSDDLENWKILRDLIDFSDRDPKQVGVQYVSFIFDGADILYLCRTAFGGAHNYHDSNYITFHKVENFRNLS